MASISWIWVAILQNLIFSIKGRMPACCAESRACKLELALGWTLETLKAAYLVDAKLGRTDVDRRAPSSERRTAHSGGGPGIKAE